MPIDMAVHYRDEELIIPIRDRGHGMSGEQLLAYSSAHHAGSLPRLIESLHGKLKVKSASLIAVSEELFAREHDNLPVDDTIALPLNNDTLSALLSFYLIADGKFTQ